MAFKYSNSHVETLLNELDQFLQKQKKQSVQSLRNTKTISSLLTDIERSRKEFDSTLFFVVIFGPLKAGKSTMVNALAREYVSPVKLGSETTLRPSIIIKSKTGEKGIEEYFLKPGPLDRDEVFHKIIDSLRGMTNPEELEKYVYITKSLLSQKNIEMKLSQPLAIEPLITVIRVPGGDFVNEKTALIDMPGFDGNKSNFEDTPIYKWVIKRTDFLIFIQSSISGISRTTVKFLEEIEKSSKNPPKWLVQNFIDGKHWRNEEERNNEAIKQLNETREAIMQELNLQREELPGTPINLGKASDGIFESNEEWLVASHFKEFENDLNTLLADRRVIINENNSLNSLINTLKNSFEQTLEMIHNLRSEEKRFVDIDLGYRQLLEDINAVEYENSHVSEKFKFDLRLLFDAKSTEYENFIATTFDYELKKDKTKVTGKEVNDRLAELSGMVYKEGISQIFKQNGPFGSEIVKMTNEMVHLIEDECLPKTRLAINALNENIQFMNIEPLSLDFEHFYYDYNRVPVFYESNPLKVKKVAEKILGMFEKKYKPPEIMDSLKENKAEFISNIHDAVKTYMDRVLFSVYKDYCEKRRSYLVDKIQASREKFKAKMNEQLDVIAKTIAFLDQYRGDLEAIDNSLKIAKNNR